MTSDQPKNKRRAPTQGCKKTHNLIELYLQETRQHKMWLKLTKRHTPHFGWERAYDSVIFQPDSEQLQITYFGWDASTQEIRTKRKIRYKRGSSRVWRR
jgi:hypothetical protein